MGSSSPGELLQLSALVAPVSGGHLSRSTETHREARQPLDLKKPSANLGPPTQCPPAEEQNPSRSAEPLGEGTEQSGWTPCLLTPALLCTPGRLALWATKEGARLQSLWQPLVPLPLPVAPSPPSSLPPPPVLSPPPAGWASRGPLRCSTDDCRHTASQACSL